MAPAERHHIGIDTTRIGLILDDALLILDTDGRITQVNQAAVRLFGESLVDRAVTELINAPISAMISKLSLAVTVLSNVLPARPITTSASFVSVCGG